MNNDNFCDNEPDVKAYSTITNVFRASCWCSLINPVDPIIKIKTAKKRNCDPTPRYKYDINIVRFDNA